MLRLMRECNMDFSSIGSSLTWEMRVSPARAEVIYEGGGRYCLEVTRGLVEDEAAIRIRVPSGMGPMLRFYPTTCGNCLIRMEGSVLEAA